MPYREAESGLGPLRGAYGWRLTGTFALVGAALIGGACVLAAALSTPAVWLVAPVLIAAGVSALGVALWMRRNRVELYERGLFHRWAGRETRLPYDHIVSIAKDVTPSGHHVVVRHREGELVVTHGLERIEALVRDLEARSFQARLARAEEGLEGSGAVFGEIRLDREVLTIYSSKLAVTELSRIERHDQFGDAKVSIHTRSQARWRTLKDVEVADVDVLATLVERLTARA